MKKQIKYKIRRIMLLYIPTLIIYIGMFDYGIWQYCMKGGEICLIEKIDKFQI